MTGAMFARLLQRYGQRMQRQGLEESFCAFLQPIRERSGKLLLEATPLGAADERKWLCLAPHTEKLERGELLQSGGLCFRVQHAAALCIGSETVYNRAILLCVGEVTA